MANDVSTLSARIVAAALETRPNLWSPALPPEALQVLFSCAVNFIGAGAEAVLRDRVLGAVFNGDTGLEVETGSSIRIRISKDTQLESGLTVPLHTFVEMYVLLLGELIGMNLCLRHLNACYSAIAKVGATSESGQLADQP